MASTISYNGTQVSTETPLGQELLKWEVKRPFQQYPRMVYKATKGSDGVVRCLEAEPNPYGFPDMALHQKACDYVRAKNAAAVRIVDDEDEYKRAFGEGWRPHPLEAEEAVKGWEHDMQVAAAERAHADRNMSVKAKEEIRQAEAATPEVLAEVPEKRTLKASPVTFTSFVSPEPEPVPEPAPVDLPKAIFEKKIDMRTKAGREAKARASA